MAFPLLLFFFGGCSANDDDKSEAFDGVIVERPDGKKVWVYEIKEYPKSVKVWGLTENIPCQPIGKSDIPLWLYNEIIDMGARDITCYLFIGEWRDTSEKMCILWGPAQSFMFNNVFYFDKGEKYIVDSDNFQEFWISTTNWKCVYIVEHEICK